MEILLSVVVDAVRILLYLKGENMSEQSELFELSMSEEAQPLMDLVKKHCEENVAPIQEEFYSLQKEKEDRWTWHPRQMELLEGAKDKARELGLWTFFLPDNDGNIGEGLTNLDYTYIATELGNTLFLLSQ